MKAAVSRLGSSGSAPGAATLSSPIPGVVVAIAATPGEVLAATADAFTVANLDTVMVLAQIPEAAAAAVAVGDSATIALPAGARTWSGHIATLAAVLDRQSRTLPARIRLPNPGQALRAGMFVDVTITADLDRESAMVPTAAVQLVADKRVVFTPEGGDRFQAHDVTTRGRAPGHGGDQARHPARRRNRDQRQLRVEGPAAEIHARRLRWNASLPPW